MTDFLSPNANAAVQTGQVVLDIGGDVWLPYAQAILLGYTSGYLLGIVLVGNTPGNPLRVVVEGRIPWATYNLGSGKATTIVAGPYPSRGSTGVVIGTVDPSGTIFVQPTYVQILYGLTIQQTVSGGQSIQALVGAIVYVDATGGTCPVTPPAVVANAWWGISDAHHGSPPTATFNNSQGADVPVGGVNLEDPVAATGVMVTGTLHIRQPSELVVWQGDPTGTFWKQVY